MKTYNIEEREKENDNSESGKKESKKSPLSVNDSLLNDITNKISLLDFETSSPIAEEKIKELKEDKKERTPKTKKKTSKALQAEEKTKLLEITRSFVGGINEVLTQRIGENFNHEKEELDTYSILIFAILEKHFPNLSEFEYAEELALGMYVFGQETPRIINHINSRKNAE